MKKTLRAWMFWEVVDATGEMRRISEFIKHARIRQIPEWFGTAIVGAVLATLGYVARSINDWWKARKVSRRDLLISLQDLASLLRESFNLYLAQNSQARRLMTMLVAGHPRDGLEDMGFESAFSQMHDKFTPPEAEIHSIIRGTTENSLRRVNESMSKWLDSDKTFRTGKSSLEKGSELAAMLHNLELHLDLWHDKYKAWIPNNPKHALVYLADENQHGGWLPKGH